MLLINILTCQHASRTISCICDLVCPCLRMSLCPLSKGKTTWAINTEVDVQLVLPPNSRLISHGDYSTKLYISRLINSSINRRTIDYKLTKHTKSASPDICLQQCASFSFFLNINYTNETLCRRWKPLVSGQIKLSAIFSRRLGSRRMTPSVYRCSPWQPLTVLKMRSIGQRSRSHGYGKGHDRSHAAREVCCCCCWRGTARRQDCTCFYFVINCKLSFIFVFFS